MILGDKITIIEPHADDAFLSCGGHIAEWIKRGTPVKIVTVFSRTRNRAADAKAYADALGAAWQGLGYTEDGGGANTGGVGDFPTPLPYEVEPGEILVTPLGIQHPEHKAVRAAFPNVMMHYLDQPYAMTMKNANEVQGKLVGTRIISYMRPSAHKYRHIRLFKDQAKFFFYNPVDKLKAGIELIIEDELL